METEVVVPRLKTDLVELFLAVPMKNWTKPRSRPEKRDNSYGYLEGYPEDYEKEKLSLDWKKLRTPLFFCNT
jgi:phosphoribosylamine--glycine ligase